MKFSTKVFLGAMDNLIPLDMDSKTLQLHILRTKEHFLIFFMIYKVKMTYKYIKKSSLVQASWAILVANWAQVHVHAFILKLSVQVFLNLI